MHQYNILTQKDLQMRTMRTDQRHCVFYKYEQGQYEIGPRRDVYNC